MKPKLNKTYFIKKGNTGCYATFIKSEWDYYLFNNSGLEIMIRENELKECVSE